MGDNITATEALVFAEQVSRDDQIFSRTVEAFIRQWGPRDPAELAQFSTDLMNLMRHMWAHTENPAQRTLDRVIDDLVTKSRPLISG